MLKQALAKAKKENEKKVSINFQVPISLKEEFDNLCRNNTVSLTAMLNSLMEVAIDESKIDTTDTKNESISQLQSTIMSMHELIEKNVDESDVGFDPFTVKQAAENKLKKLAGIQPNKN